MSVGRYLFTVWILIMAAMLAVIVVIGEPLALDWGLFLVGFPIITGGMAASIRRFAERTPPEARNSFWAYRQSNWILVAFGAALVWATASVML